MKFLTNIPLKLKTSEGEIILKIGDTFTPKNEEVIRPLLDRGVIRPYGNNTPFNTLWGLFKDSLKRVDNPSMDEEAWGRLNDIAIACMKGKASLEEYKDTLNEWEKGLLIDPG